VSARVSQYKGRPVYLRADADTRHESATARARGGAVVSGQASCSRCAAPPVPGGRGLCEECLAEYEWDVGYVQGRLGGPQTAGSMEGYDAGRRDARAIHTEVRS